MVEAIEGRGGWGRGGKGSKVLGVKELPCSSLLRSLGPTSRSDPSGLIPPDLGGLCTPTPACPLTLLILTALFRIAVSSALWAWLEDTSSSS